MSSLREKLLCIITNNKIEKKFYNYIITSCRLYMQSIIKQGSAQKYIMLVDVLEDQSLMFTLAMDGLLTGECFMISNKEFSRGNIVIDIGKVLAYTRLCNMEDPITIEDLV